MKKVILLLVLVWGHQITNAQSYDTLYYNQEGNISDNMSGFFSKVTLNKLGDKKFKSMEYYHNGMLKAECNYYTDKISKVNTKNHRELYKKKKVLPHGFYKFYDENGNLTTIDEFNMGKILYSKNILNDGREVYTVLEEEPAQYPGGLGEFSNYISENLVYPKQALNNGIEGMAFVKFIISKSGDIIEPQIVKSLSAEIDTEILKMLSKAPKWIPAKYNGIPVEQFMTIPIKLKN